MSHVAGFATSSVQAAGLDAVGIELWCSCTICQANLVAKKKEAVLKACLGPWWTRKLRAARKVMALMLTHLPGQEDN